MTGHELYSWQLDPFLSTIVEWVQSHWYYPIAIFHCFVTIGYAILGLICTWEALKYYAGHWITLSIPKYNPRLVFAHRIIIHELT
jgi:hypothetical protein